MADVADAAQEFRDLAVSLRLVGQDGLRRELYKAISDAAKPLAEEIRSTAHLDEYLPDRYAAVLARDLRVTTYKNTSISNPGVRLVASAPTVNRGSRGRQIQTLEQGRLRHPVFADRTAPRRTWRWKEQTGGMRPGFFGDPAQRSAPRVREQILAAVRRAEDMALGRP